MREPELSTLIAKELGRETNRRFLNRMPGFEVEQSVPEQLLALLERLDDREETFRPYSPRYSH